MTKNINQTFYKTMKAYCLLKSNKNGECMELLQEIKTNKPSDPVTAKYLLTIYNEMGMYHETTSLLEYVLSINLDNEELCEELFFSYVRESKLLKQQNQALQLYKTFQRDIHA